MARGSQQDPAQGHEQAEERAERRSKGRWGRLFSRAGRSAELLRDAAQELRRSPPVQHALAARERGNLEAAFWLLAEEFNDRPDDPDVNRAYWDVAVELQRVDLAAPAGVDLIHRHAAAGEEELAAQYWLELVAAAPDVFVSPTAIASILPTLRRLLDNAPEEELMELQGFVRRALRHAVDPRNKGLRPGVALRLFEQGRDLNPEAARIAAEIALESPDLHETKRDRLQAWLNGEDPDPGGEWPSAAPNPSEPSERPAGPLGGAGESGDGGSSRANGLSEVEIAEAAARLPRQWSQQDDPVAARPPERCDGSDEVRELEPPAPLPEAADLKRIEAVPTALAADHLELRGPEGGRSRIAYPDIEAVCVVEVEGLADEPVAVIDLLLNWSRQGVEPLRVVRLRGDRFDGAELVPGSCLAGDELASFLGELLLRSRAVPLPDPESALGLQLTRFESLAGYESEVLCGLLPEETTGSED